MRRILFLFKFKGLRRNKRTKESLEFSIEAQCSHALAAMPAACKWELWWQHRASRVGRSKANVENLMEYYLKTLLNHQSGTWIASCALHSKCECGKKHYTLHDTGKLHHFGETRTNLSRPSRDSESRRCRRRRCSMVARTPPNGGATYQCRARTSRCACASAR